MSIPDPARRSDRARSAILAAALATIDDVGYPNATIEGIARRAGVGKQTIYRWWPAKGHVVLDALTAAGPPADAALPDSGDFAHDLRELVRATVQELSDRQTSGTLRCLLIEMQSDLDLAEQIRTRLLGPQLAATRERLRSAQRAGQVVSDLDLDVAVELFFGPIYHRWVLQTGDLDQQYADAVAGLALRALTP